MLWCRRQTYFLSCWFIYVTPAFMDANIFLIQCQSQTYAIQGGNISPGIASPGPPDRFSESKDFYFYKACTSRAETQMCSKTSGDITSEGAQIIVTPSASSPTLEFWLYLCVRAAPGWSSGAAERGLKCHIYRCLLLAFADISQIFHLQEREKRKGKTHISFSERKNGVMRCAFPMYPNYILKEPFKRHFKKLSKDHWSHGTEYFLSK